MPAREAETALLTRCADVAGGSGGLALDAREANVFQLAAMVLQSRFPVAATRLAQASDRYFAAHPEDLLPSAEVVRRGWVSSLPRLRDTLSRQLGDAEHG